MTFICIICIRKSVYESGTLRSSHTALTTKKCHLTISSKSSTNYFRFVSFFFCRAERPFCRLMKKINKEKKLHPKRNFSFLCVTKGKEKANCSVMLFRFLGFLFLNISHNWANTTSCFTRQPINFFVTDLNLFNEFTFKVHRMLNVLLGSLLVLGLNGNTDAIKTSGG